MKPYLLGFASAIYIDSWWHALTSHNLRLSAEILTSTVWKRSQWTRIRYEKRMVRVLASFLKKVRERICPGSLFGIQVFFPSLESYYQNEEASIIGNKWQELLKGVGGRYSGGKWPWRWSRATKWGCNDAQENVTFSNSGSSCFLVPLVFASFKMTLWLEMQGRERACMTETSDLSNFPFSRVG